MATPGYGAFGLRAIRTLHDFSGQLPNLCARQQPHHYSVFSIKLGPSQVLHPGEGAQTVTPSEGHSRGGPNSPPYVFHPILRPLWGEK